MRVWGSVVVISGVITIRTRSYKSSSDNVNTATTRHTIAKADAAIMAIIPIIMETTDTTKHNTTTITTRVALFIHCVRQSISILLSTAQSWKQ